MVEKLYTYGRMLLRKLPRPEGGEHWDPGEDVVLASLKLKKDAEGRLGLQKDQGGVLGGPLETGSAAAKTPKEKLSTIIEILNNRFGLDLPDHVEKVLDGVADGLAASEEIQLAAKANDKANFGHVFIPAFKDALVDHHAENGQFVDLVFRDEQLMNALNALMMDRVYGRLTVTDDDAAGGDEPAQVVPFRRVLLEEARPFDNCVPALDLKVVAGSFSAEQVVDGMPQPEAVAEPGRYDWVAFEGHTKPAPDIFVAQVVGESMNRRIPNGAWCVWRINPAGSRQGKVVLAQHRDIQDPEHGGQYTVKVYQSEKETNEDGGWRHRRVTLKPDSTDPAFEPIVLEGLEEGELKIVAELVEVLS